MNKYVLRLDVSVFDGAGVEESECRGQTSKERSEGIMLLGPCAMVLQIGCKVTIRDRSYEKPQISPIRIASYVLDNVYVVQILRIPISRRICLTAS